MHLIPMPQELKIKKNHFIANLQTEIVIVNSGKQISFNTAKHLKDNISLLLGYNLAINASLDTKRKNCIYLTFDDLEDEEYSIDVSEEKIVLSGGSNKGLFYAVVTFLQILINSNQQIPCLTINDKPDYKNRGFYHDVTRGKVPTIQTLKHIVDVCALYKLNQFQFYIEHSFAFKNTTEIWSDIEPLTAEEVLELVNYGNLKHVEIIPSLSTFGHLYRILKSQSFYHLCELEDSLTNDFSFIDRMRHHTLDVSNEDSIKFVHDMLNEFIPLFTSDKFNICADETFDLGKGKNKLKADSLGVGKLYVDFLNKIITVVKEYHKQPMVWGDIISKHPEYIMELPNDTIFLHWDYSKNPNKDIVKLFGSSNKEFYVCPSTHAWNKLINHFENSHANILKLAMYGKDYNANGLLNTDWGDFGHTSFLANSVVGIIYGACYSWNIDSDNDFDKINQKISFVHYFDKSLQLVNILNQISKNHIFTMRELVFFLEKNETKEINKITSESEILKSINEVSKLVVVLEGYLVSVPSYRKLALKEFINSAVGVKLLNELLLVIRKYELDIDIDTKLDPKVLAVKIEYWFNDFSKLWRMRNKESELFRLKDLFIEVCSRLRTY